MKAPVKLAFGRGTYTVEARIYGPLAVHRCRSRAGVVLEGWNITHIRTGARLFPKRYTMREAVALAKALQDIDWDWGTFGVQVSGRKGKARLALDGMRMVLEERGLI